MGHKMKCGSSSIRKGIFNTAGGLQEKAAQGKESDQMQYSYSLELHPWETAGCTADFSHLGLLIMMAQDALHELP
jgi:hypothetical protein